jgi:hypothetical protein
MDAPLRVDATIEGCPSTGRLIEFGDKSGDLPSLEIFSSLSRGTDSDAGSFINFYELIIPRCR